MTGKDRGNVLKPPSNQHDLAMLERLVDPSHNDATIIIAAGLGVYGTMGAVQYLIDHWQELNRKYGNRNFALVLQFGPLGKLSPEDRIKGSLIRQFPE